MERRDFVAQARFAGTVERYHVWPTIRRQTVADHTFGVLRLYWQIFGPLPAPVSTAIIWSDAGELSAGDMPFHAKAASPELKAHMDRLEAAAVANMGGPVSTPLLSSTRKRIKVCDLLEMHEFGLMEVAMGNTFAEVIVNDTWAALMEVLGEMSQADGRRVRAYVDSIGSLRTA